MRTKRRVRENDVERLAAAQRRMVATGELDALPRRYRLARQGAPS
jgi:hypothetical protein